MFFLIIICVVFMIIYAYYCAIFNIYYVSLHGLEELVVNKKWDALDIITATTLS